MRETPKLSGEELLCYRDLIKYAIFLRDVRGKSQSGDKSGECHGGKKGSH